MMTRKDYVKVSEILHARKNWIPTNEFHIMVQDFSAMFFDDNPNFSARRFELACFGDDENGDVK